jgi:hypothetical protein
MDSQIFYIHGSKGRFAECYRRRGYLPPIEYPEENFEQTPLPTRRDFTFYPKGYSKLLDRLEQVEFRMGYFDKNLNSILKKDKGRLNYKARGKQKLTLEE